jgi:hypothetical protein
MLFPAPASVPGTSNRSASHRAALLREHARALADQAAREGRQDRARYLADQAATFERAAALLEAPPARTLWTAKPVGTGGPGWHRY